MNNEIVTLSLSQKFAILTTNNKVDQCIVNHSFKEECLKLQKLTINHYKLLSQLVSGFTSQESSITSVIMKFYSHLMVEEIITEDNIDSYTDSELRLIFKNLNHKYTLNQSLMKALAKFS